MGRGRNQSATSGSSKKNVKSKPGAILMENYDQESSDGITLPQESRITRRRLTLAKEQSEKDKTSKIEAISTSLSTPIMNTNVDAPAPSRGRQRGRSRRHLNKSTTHNLANIGLSIESEVLDSENTASTEDMPIINSEEMFIDNINNVDNVVEIGDYSQIANTLVENSDSDDKQTITMPDKMKNFETGSYAMSSLDDDSQSQSDSVLAQQDENSNNPEEEYVAAQAQSPVSQEGINLDNSHDQTSKINPSLYAFASPPHGNKQSEETVRDLSGESTQKIQSPIPTSLAKSSLSHRNTPTPDRIVSSPEILHVRTNLKAPRTYQNKRRGKSISSTKGQKQPDGGVTKNVYPIAIFQSQDKSNIIQDKSSGQDTLSIAPECRRSQRNRIIKYDIRDLLNKNRRSKIQIESKVVLKPNSDNSSPSLSSNVSSSLSSKDKSSEEYDTDRSSYLDSPKIFKGFSDSDNSKNSPIRIKEKITSSQKRISPARSNTQKKEISIQTDLDLGNKEICIELSSNSGQTVASSFGGVAQKEKTEITKTTKILPSRQSCDEGSLQSSFSALGESSMNNPITHKKTRSERVFTRTPVRHLRPSVSKTVAPPIIEIFNEGDSSEDERELRPIMDFNKKPTRTQEIFSKCLKRSQRVESLIESQIKPQRSLISNKFNTLYEPPKPIPFNHCEENVINLIDDTSNESTSSSEILKSTKLITSRQKYDEPDKNKVEKYQEVRDTESSDGTVIVVEVQDDDDSIEEISPDKGMEVGGTKTDTSVSQVLDCSKEINLSAENEQKPGKARSRRSKQCTELNKAKSVMDKEGKNNTKDKNDEAAHIKTFEDRKDVEQLEEISDKVSSTHNKTISKNDIQECRTQVEPLFQEAEKTQKTSTIDTMHQDTEEMPQKVKTLKSCDDEQKLVSKPSKEKPSRKIKMESESRECIEHHQEKKEDDELFQNKEETIEKATTLKSINSQKMLIKRRGRRRKIKLGSELETTMCTEEDKEKRRFPKYEEDSSSNSVVFEIRKVLEETVAEEKEIIAKQSAEKISEMIKPRKTRSSKKSLEFLDESNSVNIFSVEDIDNSKKVVEIEKDENIVNKVKEKSLKPRKQKKSDIVEKNEKIVYPSEVDSVKAASFEEPNKDFSGKHLLKEDYDGHKETTDVKSKTISHELSLEKTAESESLPKECVDVESSGTNSAKLCDSTEVGEVSSEINLEKNLEFKDTKKVFVGTKNRRVPTRLSLKKSWTRQELSTFDKFDEKLEKERKTQEDVRELTATISKETTVKYLEDPYHLLSTTDQYQIDFVELSSSNSGDYIKPTNLSATDGKNCLNPTESSDRCENKVGTIKDLNLFNAVEQSSSKVEKSIEKPGKSDLELKSEVTTLNVIEKEYTKKNLKIPKKRKTNETESSEVSIFEVNAPIKKRRRKISKVDPTDVEITPKKKKIFSKDVQEEIYSKKDDSIGKCSTEIEKLPENAIEEEVNEEVIVIDKIPEKFDHQKEGQECSTDENSSQICEKSEPSILKEKSVKKTEIAPPILKDGSAKLQESEKSKNEETTSKIEKLSEKKWSGSCEMLQVSETLKNEDSFSKGEKLSRKKKILKRRSLRSANKSDLPVKEGENKKKVEQDPTQIFAETESNLFELSGNDKGNEESAKNTSKRRSRRKESVNPFDKFEIKSITIVKDPKSSNLDAIDDLNQEVICATTSKAHCIVESSIESTITDPNIEGNFVASKEGLKELTESKKLPSKSTVIEEELNEPAESKEPSKIVAIDDKELIEQFESKKSAVKQKNKCRRESSENIKLENELLQHDNCNEISDRVEKIEKVIPRKSIVRKNSIELVNSKKTAFDRARKLGRKRAFDVHNERKSSVDFSNTMEKSKSDKSHDFLQDKKPKDDAKSLTKNLECGVPESNENILLPCETFDCLEQKDNKNDQQDLYQKINLLKTVEKSEEKSEIIKHSLVNEQSQQKFDEKTNEEDEKKTPYEISSSLNLSDVHSTKSAIKSVDESEIKQGSNKSSDSKTIKITNEKIEKSEKSKSKLSEDDSTIDSIDSSQTSFKSQNLSKSIDQKPSKQPHASEKVKSKLEENLKLNDSDRDKEKKPHKKSSSRNDSSHKKSEKSKASEDSRKIPTKEEKERILSSVYCPQKTTTIQESINTFVLGFEKDKNVKSEDTKYSSLYKGDKKDDPKYCERSSIHKERKDSKDIISKSRNFERSTKPNFDKYHYYRKDKEHSKPSISSESLKKDTRDSRDNSSESSSDRHQSKDDKCDTSQSSDKDDPEKKYWQSFASTTKDSAPQKISEKENVSLKFPEVCISSDNTEKAELTKPLSFENLYRTESVKDEIFISTEKAIDDEVKKTSELINAEIAMIQNFTVKEEPSPEDHFGKSEQILNVQETIEKLNNEIKSESTFGNIQTFVFSNYEDKTTFKEGTINIGENVIKSNVEIVKSKDKTPRVRKSRWDQVSTKEKDLNIPELQTVPHCEQQVQRSKDAVGDTKQLIKISSENTNETKSSETKVCPLLSKAALKAYPAEISFIVSKTVAQQFENIGKRNSSSDSISLTMADSLKSVLSTEVTENSSNSLISKYLPAYSSTEISSTMSINEITPHDSTTNILPLSEASSKLNEDSQTSFKEDKEKPDEEKSTSPNSDKQSSSKEDSQDSQEDLNSSNIRRSHRIKSISKTKQAVGRGLVRDKERFIDCDDKMPMYISSADLEAENAKFLKDMEERLSQFQVIKENEYRCERVISKEAKKMTCDCFLTREEEDRGELGCGEDCLNRLLMIECGPKCVVGDRCTNRRFQKNLYAPCKVFRTEKKGFGIMADGDILAGEFIMEYIGEVLNDKQFRKRAEVYSKDKNKHYYFMALRSDAIIDATGKGNISRFINHSCDPNAETQKWTVNGELRIGFFSRRRITPGEEITFDYQFQRYGKEAQKCYCESANCRGWIGEEPDSDEEESSSESENELDKEILLSEKEIDKPIEVPVPAPLPVPPICGPMPVPPPGLIPLPVPPPIPLSEEIEVQKPDMETQTTELPSKPQVERKKQKHRKEFRLTKKKAEFLEDPDLEEEIESLTHTGLKNQAHTLRLNRLMVRGKMLATRVRLLEILRGGELPCRRLFLDYHGLRLLHGWMNENEIKDIEKELEVRLLMVQILQVLPIPNKTMLIDSKVYQTIENWANEKEILPESSPNDSPTDSGSATPVNSSSCTESNLVVEDAKQKVEITHPLKTEIARISCKLLDMWEGLPEVFRIPKRERIEQMKEHEREADRMFKALNLIDEDIDKSNRSNDRFGKNKRITVSTNIHTWVREKVEKKPKERERDILTDIDTNLTKLQRRQLFAAKVAKDEEEKRLAEERREYEVRCKFYGLDPEKTQPTDMPFYVNPATGQWFSTDKIAIETPPSHAHIPVPSKPQSTDPKDYRILPMDLPPFWKYAIDQQGRIYYYHVKIRIPQWQPPIKIEPLVGSTEQKDEPIPSTSTEIVNEVIECQSEEEEDESSTSGSDEDVSESKIRKIVKLLPDDNVDDNDDNDNNDTSTASGQGQELKRERKMERYKLLVQERPISPRREEDRLYNQLEMKRYKENKEKIRKRREVMKRKKAQLIKENITSPPPSSPTPDVDKTLDETVPLPIQDYLFSSDEEEQLRADCTSPLLEMFVQGDKIVDELDALKKEKPLKRSLPIKEKSGQQRKRVKTDERKKSEESKESKSPKLGKLSGKYLARKAKEKFRSDIAGVIVHHLTPYRKDSCQIGRITNNEDFKHLARKLTHFVMIKELKHCDLTGQVLEVTESVKNKSREFIKKYMAKYGEIYIRPENDPEFKDIPHKD